LHDAHHQEPLAFVGVPSFLSSGLILVVCYLPLRGVAPVLRRRLHRRRDAGLRRLHVRPPRDASFQHPAGDWLYQARLRHMTHHYAKASITASAPASGTACSARWRRGASAPPTPELTQRLARAQLTDGRSPAHLPPLAHLV